MSSTATQPQSSPPALVVDTGPASWEAKPLTYGPFWTCPVSGLKVPTELRSNLEYRRLILEHAERDPGYAAALIQLCRESVLFWFKTFAWTYVIKQAERDGAERAPPSPHQPFITWPAQDDAILDIESAITGGYPLLIDKSRDQGATWLILAIMKRRWSLLSDQNFLLLSRTEDLVDGPGKKMAFEPRGNPDTLFWKLDYLGKYLPEWMRPPAHDVRRSFKHLERLGARCTFDGEATTSHSGQGGRRTAIMFDEFARVPNGHDMMVAAAATSACRIFNSTPQGRGTAHTKARFSGKIKVVVLSWINHPRHGLGRECITDSEGRRKWTSPFYRRKQAEAISPREISENWDIDHGAAGSRFFDSGVLNMVRSTQVRPPRHRGAVVWTPAAHDPQRPDWTPTGDDGLRAREPQYTAFTDRTAFQPWSIWCPLFDRSGREVKPGEKIPIDARPRQNTHYSFGMDVGHGLGVSNTVIVVKDIATDWKVAEFASATMDVADATRVLVAAAVWFGGWQLPLLVWEANGPGQTVYKWLKLLEYPRCYFRRDVKKKGEDHTQDHGWDNGGDRKEYLLTLFRTALTKGQFRDPCQEAVDEADTYEIADNGRSIGPSREMQDEMSGAEKTHGDRVIANALAWLGQTESPRIKSTAADPPINTVAGRRAAVQRAKLKKAANDWS